MLDIRYMISTIYFWMLGAGIIGLLFGWLLLKAKFRIVAYIVLLAAVAVILYCLYYLWLYVVAVGV